MKKISSIRFVLAFCTSMAGIFSGQAQVSVTVGNNPAAVVIMGDSLTFSGVTTLTAQSYPDAEVEITVPPGFELLTSSPGFIQGSLSQNKRTGRILRPVPETTPVAFTVYVKPLCDAQTATPAQDRKIQYVFYENSTATVFLVSEQTSPISNFYDPILNVVYPAGATVTLNTPITRVIEITQTAAMSHVNNLQINAACDRTGITVSKIEVSSDNSSWTDVTASALNSSQPGKYVYNITRDNTFTPLQYAGGQLRTGDKIYLRETVTLTKCSAGAVAYSISYGDGTTYCDPLTSAAGNVNLAVATPAFGTDILGPNSDVVWPSSPTNDGMWKVQVINNSNDPSAVLKDVYLHFGMGTQYYMKKAFICNPAGAAIPAANGDTLWLNVDAGTGAYRRMDFENFNEPAKAADYTGVGLIDADGDGKYNDLNIQDTVHIRIIFNITMGSLSTTQCNSLRFIPGVATTGWGYYKFCDSYVQFGRAYNGGGASWWHDGFQTMEIREPKLTPAMLTVGDKAKFTFVRFDHSNNGFLDTQHGPSGTSSYYIDITLPAGLELDIAEPYPVILRNNNGTVYGTGGNLSMASGYIILDGGTDLQHFRIRVLPDLDYYATRVEIAVKATGTPDPTGAFSTVNLFDYGNTSNFYMFGCHSPAVNYIVTGNCSDIELKDFSVERTTFGYTDITKTARITKAAGANVKVIYPFDTVSLTANMKVNATAGITLTGTDTILASASYQSAGSATSNAYLIVQPGVTYPGTLELYRGGILQETCNIPAADIRLRAATVAGVGNMQYMETDIAKALGSENINALQTGDSLVLTLKARSTEQLPLTNETALRPTKMTLYRNSAEICYPGIDNDVRMIQHTFTYVATDDPDAPTSWQERTESRSCDLFYGFNKSYGGVNLLTAGEYRPNVDYFSDLTFVFTSLIRVNSILLVLSAPAMGNETTQRMLTSPADYRVSYGGGKTTIVINPLKDHMFTGAASSAWAGYRLYFYWDAINMADGFYATSGNGKTVTFTATEYPTSVVPQPRTYSNRIIGTEHNESTKDFYRINVMSNAPLQSPTGEIVEWNLAIENNSVWVNDNDILPYTWIAFEVPAGVTPSKLIDVTGGNTVVADIANSGEFITYGPSGSTYYWVKLDSISCPVPRQYKLQCTYTVCSGTPSFDVRVGMSKLDYPEDPYNSFSQPLYDSRYMPIHASSSVNLKFTPPAVDFSGILTHRPSTGQGEKNNFCDTVGFTAEFHNGLTTEVSNLKLEVTLPAGFTYDQTVSAQVKFGAGYWQPAADVTTSDNVLSITLDNDQKLTAYETPGDAAYVDFRLKIACGADNNQSVYARFIGESGCGAQAVKTYNSRNILIAGLEAPPDYWVEQLSLSTPRRLVSPTNDVNDGVMTLTGQYRLANPPADSIYAVIDLPANVQMLSSSAIGGMMFQQDGTRLTLKMPNVSGQDTINAVYPFTVNLRAVNPAQWSMDSVRIIVRTGRLNELTCGTTCTVLEYGDCEYCEDEIKFAMQKLEVNFSTDITAVSRYKDASHEHVEISGKLVNSCAYPTDVLNMDLWYHNGTTGYVQVGTPSGLTVTDVPAHDSVSFTVTVDVPSNQNICAMKLMLRKNNTSGNSRNPYLADSVLIDVPNPRYEIQTQPAPVCQTATVSIGEQPITGYSYTWSPADHLTTSSGTPVDFSYDYAASPIYNNNTVLQYLVTVTRPNNCQSIDTIFVPLKKLPFVDAVPDDTICSGGTLIVNFTDVHNTGSTYKWTAPSNTVGMPTTQGTGNNISQPLTNTGTSPATVTITVTPTIDGCDGVSKQFTITVLPLATAAMITVGDATVCRGASTNLTASLTTPGSVTNPVYKWYNSSNALLHTGATYHTGALTATATYYVSVSGDNYCENSASARRAVTVTVPVFGEIVYVKTDGTGDGSSWANAYPNLADPLADAKTISCIKEIWVAEGTYYPTRRADNINTVDPTNRNNAFVLVDGVKIYGGFANPLPVEGSPVPAFGAAGRNGVSVLSGDINNIGSNTDNAYHVVVGAGTLNTATTVLDGFTVTGGYASSAPGDTGPISVNGQSLDRNEGGGIALYSAAPLLENLIITGNTAYARGGGINCYNSSPRLNNVEITDNHVQHNHSSLYGGGGMCNYMHSSPVLTNVVISNNTAIDGGGIFNFNSSPVLTNVLISGNTVSGNVGAGGQRGGGGMKNYNSSSVLTNVQIIGNTADGDVLDGGGILNSTDIESSQVLTNVVISGNTARRSGGGMFNYGSTFNPERTTVNMTNVQITGNTAYGGGGIYNNIGCLVLTNVTIAGNYATIITGGIHNGNYQIGSTTTIRNSIVYGNICENQILANNVNGTGITYNYSLVGDATLGSGIILNGDPLFVNHVAASLAPTSAGNYSLRACSPAIDKGHNNYNTEPFDLDGNTRIHNSLIDLGAYEFIGTPLALATDGTVQIDNDTVCYGSKSALTLTAPAVTPPLTYRWYSSQTAETPFHTGDSYTTSALTADTVFYISVEGASHCENLINTRKQVTVKVRDRLSQDAASPSQVICYNNAPSSILYGGAVNGGKGIGSYSYLWQQSDDDGANWADVSPNGTSANCQPPALTQTVKYRRIVLSDGGSCGIDTSNVLTVRVYPQAILNYPDFRIWACPGAPGSTINLSKYLDTIESPTIVWDAAAGSPPINASGIIDADNLAAARTYTYTYTVTNPCVTDMTRKVYLRTLKGNSLKQPQDTVTLCYETAEAVNINQIFGIDAGGAWLYSSPDGNISSYVTESAASGGAVIMNGKGIYTDPSINFDGTTGNTKRVVFTYKSDNNSCLGGKEYKMVIILTPDMM